ncbi:hypothetical protein BG910_01715 [Neisseria chenwenguii]|uniref:HTH tetR-type domain-containing protein n=1 Tax=Neisseria chenwenguii TaxID=1853278 RepID=A0A220RZR5_9NEIS|nr:TetR family transcriptional regulator [Neisseria chenwenguii]ASK26628.1 hypothetical protein BG910_01715 [Neisseria chenwenguii]
MTENTRTRFLEPGLRLYPQYGCQKLTVRLLAAETGLSLGMFHHHFASKDAFIGELLTLKYETALAGMMA